MTSQGIAIDWPYAPLMHLQPAFKDVPYSNLSKSESLSEKHLCLPIHMQIDKHDAEFIAKKFIDCFKS